MKKHHFHYTLIEVLVAVAVLALMMSFLFQFTSGAQRIWTATNANTDITSNADAIFALLDEDLTQMIVDADAGMSYTNSGGDFGFYAISGRRGGVKAGGGDSVNEIGSLVYVQYHYDSADSLLYRVQKSAADNDLYSNTDNTELKTGVTTFANTDYTADTLVAEGVTAFTVTPHPNAMDVMPQILHVQVTLDRTAGQISELKSDTNTNFEHVFSKVYFPGMR